MPFEKSKNMASDMSPSSLAWVKLSINTSMFVTQERFGNKNGPTESRTQSFPDGGQAHWPLHQLDATLIAADLGINTSTKARRLRPNNTHKLQPIEKFLPTFKVQFSAKPSLLELPPKGILLGGAIRRTSCATGPDRDTLPVQPHQKAQESKRTHVPSNALDNNNPVFQKVVLHDLQVAVTGIFSDEEKNYVLKR
ncbi:hypothetical protein CSKR_202594 [Clonorchis sinensis]|uniref:Uncharacterized protein n=1 Tax=Clonorchis sinensis TaxID=79923 RepID=A0A8T1M108_CLOSI|nr:hypothetical protein CSKR_202594 [Clonorchis sinensis]